MPKARVNGVNIHYEDVGQGTPIVFVHEFAGEARSWDLQVRFFSRRYRTITYDARGYPPSDVPEDPKQYSQQHAVDDLFGLIEHLKLDTPHVVGLSMGGYAVLHFGIQHPDRARSLVIAGCGYGTTGDRESYRKDVELTVQKFEREGMAKSAEFYSRGPTRVQFIDKDPKGWQEFHDLLAAGSAKGHANTLLGVQLTRPSVYDLGEAMSKIAVPTLVITGDEDEPCIEPSVFMKRKIPTAGLVVLPKSGHTINLEEPEAFNRAVLDFITAVDAGRWTRRNPASLAASAILPAEMKR